ncbi:MAG: tRNA (adenosine(37)-N6)-dimethylallyltransferase MiaA [Sphingomonadaceae bacterium]
MDGKKPPLAVIAGPTASGKTARALELAAARQGVIINADASQVYADLDIIAARPTVAEQARAPHRLFGIVDAADAMTAVRWAALARAEIEAAWAAGRLPILVGGTGLYLRTLIEGIAPVPPVPAGVRAEVRALAPAEVRAALEAEDPAMAARLQPGDPQRNARALEVIRGTGRSLLAWQAEPRAGGLGHLVALAPLVLAPPRDELDRRIEARIEAMWAAGALDEVRRLKGRGLPPTLPAMRAIGVPPLLALLHGEIGEAEALARWRLDTRRYAKRQATWFRHQHPDWPRG